MFVREKKYLCVHSRASSDMGVAVWLGEYGGADSWIPSWFHLASPCPSDHLDQCGLWTKLPAPVVC